jgi:hypothetical protein
MRYVKRRSADSSFVDDTDAVSTESDCLERSASRRRRIEADARLVARCVAGEVAAWEEMYAECHEPLCDSIKIMLGAQCDPNLLDEIAARVWYALVANDGELLGRFDPNRGARFATFMRVLAKDEICSHFRAEIRRREREFASVHGGPQQSGEPEDPTCGLEEFLVTLNSSEREFCDQFLLGQPTDEQREKRSSASIWQATRRIYKKMMSFLGGSDECPASAKP